MNFDRSRHLKFIKAMAGAWLLWAGFTFGIAAVAIVIIEVLGAVDVRGDLADIVGIVGAFVVVGWLGPKLFRR